ncbi:MAG: signal peptide peptidase SppA [Candidatus Brocadiia bacterium]
MNDTTNTGMIQPEIRKGKTASFWISIILGILLVFSALGNFILLIALAAKVGSVGQYNKSDFNETFVHGDNSADHKIVCITVSGPIIRDSAPSMFNQRLDPVSTVMESLEMAKNDHDVKAIILEVNSPGGGITESDQIYNELLRFKKARPEVKIITSMDSVAASGGYYISMATDRVVARPTTITGSIGVIMGLINMEELFKKIGVKEVIFKSGAKKDMFSPTRQITDEEKQIAQAIIKEMYDRFVSVVVEGRKNLDKEKILQLADGRIYTGQQAFEHGLVDELGDFNDAFEATKKLANLTNARVIRYKKRWSFGELFLSEMQNLKPSISLLPENSGLSMDTPRFMYLWTY